MYAKTNFHHQNKLIYNGKEFSDCINHQCPSVWNFHHPWCSANTSDFKNRVATKRWNLVASLEICKNSFLQICHFAEWAVSVSAMWGRLAVWSVASWAVDNLKIIWAIAVDKHKLWVCFSPPFILLFFPSAFLPSFLITASLPNI